MAERTPLTTFRNSDKRITYQFPEAYNLDGFSPVFYFRPSPGEAPTLTVQLIETANGSNARVVGDAVILTLKAADLEAFGTGDIYAGVYDSNLPKDGFVNKFVGGPHTQFVDGSYGEDTFSESVLIDINGSERPVIIEGGAMGPAASLALAELNEAVVTATDAAIEAEAAAETAVAATANKLNRDGTNPSAGLLTGIGAVGSAALAAGTGAALVGFNPGGPQGVDVTLAGRATYALNIKDMGADLTGVVDASDKLQGLIDRADALGASVNLGRGRLKLTKQINIPQGVAVFGDDVVLDFGTAPNNTNFPDLTAVMVNGGAYSALPALNANVTAGTMSVVFASSVAASLSPGDVFAIYNTSDYTWIKQFNGNITPTGQFAAVNRANYRAGELLIVKGVSGATVTLETPLRNSYVAANVSNYKMPNGRAIFSGKIRIECPNTVDNAFRVRRAKNVLLSGLEVRGGRQAALYIEECLNVTGQGVIATQTNNSGTGSDYGVIILSSQNVVMQGYFIGYRHGVTTGASADNPGNLCLPCRDVYLNRAGGLMGNGGSSVWAFGGHGNSQNVQIGGIALGGILLAGLDAGFNGVAFPTVSNFPLASYTEIVGGYFDWRGSQLLGAGVDPTPNGLALHDAGTQGAAPDSDTCVNMTIDLRGQEIDAPDTTRPLNVYNNNIAVPGKLTVLAGVVFRRLKAGASVLFLNGATSPTSTKMRVDVRGLVDNTAHATYADRMGYVVTAQVQVRGWEMVMSDSIAVTTAASTANGTALAIKAPRAPKVYPSCQATNNGVRVIPSWSAVSATSVTLQVATTVVATNFGANTNIPVTARLVVDEWEPL